MSRTRVSSTVLYEYMTMMIMVMPMVNSCCEIVLAFRDLNRSDSFFHCNSLPLSVGRDPLSAGSVILLSSYWKVTFADLVEVVDFDLCLIYI